MRRTILLLTIIAAMAGEAPCGAVNLKVDDPVLQECLARALPHKDMKQSVSLRVFDATGAVSESQARVYWQRTAADRLRLLVRLHSPPMRAGIAMLAIEGDREEPEVFLYLPELRQTRRMAGRTFSGSMLGTDFSYEDYIQFQGIRNSSDIRRLDDSVLEGQPVYVLEAVPRDNQSAYSRVVSYIDQQQCLPLRVEFSGRDGQLAKELTVARASVQHLADRYIPHLVVMRDHRQNSRTEIVVEDVELDTGLHDNLFRASTLGTNP